MKKLFIALVAVAFSLSAMAASTAAARIKLVGSNSTYAVSTLFLNEDDARNSSYESGYDAESMMSQSNPYSVLIYAYVGTHPCEYVATDDLDGQAISFTTNMIDADYTLYFSNISGRTLKLYDLLLNEEVTIADNGVYPFSVDPSLVGQHEVNGRFVINYVSYPAQVTTNAYGLATFSYDQDLAPVEAGVKLYKGAISGDVLGLTSVNYVKADEGVIVYGAANTTYHFNYGDGDAASFAGNELKPATAWASQGYVLSGNLLYVYDGADFPANKAFLEIPSSGAPARIRLAFDNATAIDNVEAEAVKAEKFIENGQLFIRRGNEVFNLQGQIVK
jgi:hypothetical protein